MAFNIKFNEKSIPSYVKVRAVHYSALPELENNFKQKTSGIGLIDTGTQILGKKIKVDFSIVRDNRSLLQLTQDFAKWLMGNNFNLSPLEITDGETYTFQAKVNNGVEISDAFMVGEGSIEIMDPTGVAQGSDADVAVVGNKIANYYTGSAVSFPQVTVVLTEATNNIRIQDNKGGNITVSGNFKIGDTVYIDCMSKRVKVNGYVNMKGVSLSSTWLYFPTAGTYEIQCVGTGQWSCRVPLRYY
ncbi:hypothetical protein GNF82_12105 [Clostridium perfringens]